MPEPLNFPADLLPCGWCGRDYPADWVTQMERVEIPRLCPGCYYCWQHGAPPLHDHTQS